MAVSTRRQARCNRLRWPGEFMRTNMCMKSIFLICFALAAVNLAGCVGVKTDVQASGVHQWPPGARTYRILRSPPQEVDPEEGAYETLLRDELTRYGFSDTGRSTDEPRYLISVAHEIRQAKVTVQTRSAECKGRPVVCGELRSADVPVPRGDYVHRLTFRFVDARSGEELYKVTSTARNDNDHPSLTMRYLLTGAFARFPYNGRDWQVRLRRGDDKTAVQVVSVKSVGRQTDEPCLPLERGIGNTALTAR